MAFIDELRVHVKAGKGGNGVVRWLHEKGKEFSGAAGGDGGRGGDVYARAVRDLGILAKYRHIKEFAAGKGEEGKRKSMHGANGDDLTIDVPIGTILHNLDTGKKYQLLEEGQTVMLLKGGNGGYGNEHFKSSTNITPMESTLGKPSEEADFFIEVEIVADAGLIGFPNAGKSSLLNELTNTSVKVGSYQFTTLEPNLGDIFGFILADIPGLIEGASEGKGLGHKFLRHIKRTKILLHCVSVENDDVVEAYKAVRAELEKYSSDLITKKEIIVLTKTDMVDEKVLGAKKKKLSALNSDIMTVTILDSNVIKTFRDDLVKILRAEESEKTKELEIEELEGDN